MHNMAQRFVYIISLLLVSMLAWAQKPSQPTEDALRAGEGEINRQQEFFDPTRKKDKKVEEYHFSVDYRIEAGYVQNQQRTLRNNWSDPFTHGVKIGFTADFNLPYHFSMQTGASLCATYGRIDQHWRSMNAESVQVEYLRHGINEYYLEVPIRAYYNQKLWRELNMFFFTGPKIAIGLAQMDFMTDHLSDVTRQWLTDEGIRVSNYERYGVNELRRLNIQYGLGGGMEWAQYRVVAGYDFGLNNLVKTKITPDSHMWEWGWYVSFAYKF